MKLDAQTKTLLEKIKAIGAPPLVELGVQGARLRQNENQNLFNK